MAKYKKGKLIQKIKQLVLKQVQCKRKDKFRRKRKNVAEILYNKYDIKFHKFIEFNHFIFSIFVI